jgi:hypothetical protein
LAHLEWDSGTRIGAFAIAVTRCGDYFSEYFCVSVHDLLLNIAAQYYLNEASVEHLLRNCNNKIIFLNPQKQNSLIAIFK